eukprot:Nitzschia sp. Nitz4//scaffold30_size153850//6567//9734//NITZ4_002756-RA/size153850-processed-gene-0.1-mRNA-1//1//CDS//3329547196//7841//frame0
MPPAKVSRTSSSNSCACNMCSCGPNCACSEGLCRCAASSVLSSLGHASCTRNEAQTRQATVDIGVFGMTCSMCSKSVSQALMGQEAVASVSVSLPTNSASISYDPTLTTPQELATLIEDIGYEAVLPTDVEAPTDPEPAPITTQTMDFEVQGMTCTQCSAVIQRALEDVAGVDEISINLSTNTVRVTWTPSETNLAELKETIEDVGYDVVGEMYVLEDTPNAEDDRLERMLQHQERQVLGQKRAFLWSLIGTCPILFLTMILPHLPHNKLSDFLEQEVTIGHSKFILEALILWALCTPIQFGSGWSFYRTTYHNLRMKVLGMDVLVTVGTSASYGYAVWATMTCSIEYHFFETSAVLICFVLLGKWLQTLAVRRTSQALTQLMALQPKTAVKVVPPAGADPDNTNWDPTQDTYHELLVPLHSIQKGDLVKVLKGASIPADGLVKYGEMSVDESMITGESVPVLKTKGSVVLGGTICAEAGQAVGATFVEVTGVGSATALSQIVKLVQEAQSRQVPIQSLADTISSIFVPTVVTISLITFMIWYAAIQSHIVPASYLPEGESPATFSLLFGIACLVISCPCALGLATPTAVMVGTGVGAKQGILMKGGETLELASKVDSVVFDKTGTLTQGKPAITDFSVMVPDTVFWKEVIAEEMPRSTKDHLLWLLGSLERNSEHPLATAVVKYAEECLEDRIPFVQPTSFEALTGRGTAGTIEGKVELAIGNRAFCNLKEVEIPIVVEDAMQRMERQGKTAILAVVNGVICVVMGIADQLKPDARASITYLRDTMHVDVWMVTGDNKRTARAIARQLNLPAERVIAEALPVAKVAKVQQLQSEGRVVAMVGDGVNDSPALAQADVGLGLGSGAEIAAEASDMVLVKGNVADVCTALHLSQVIFRRIKLNFLWALVYNVLGIPVAAGVLYPVLHSRLPPTVAAIAMALSSISVVASSLSLRLYQPPVIGSTRQGGDAPTSRSSRRNRGPRGTRNGGQNLNEESDLREPLLQDDPAEATQRASNVSSLEEGRAVVVAV